MVGIYKITNKVNGKVYVGKSEDINKMFEMCKNIGSDYPSKGLPIFSEISAYGVDKFEFNVLEECPVSQLLEKETYYMNMYSLKDTGTSANTGKAESNGVSKGRKNNPNVGLGLRRHIHRMRTDEAYRAQMIEKYRNNRPNAIEVDMMDKLTGEIIMTFPKIMEGARWIRENTKYVKADYSTINKVCKGNGKSAYGYRWQYTRDRDK